MRGTDWTDHEIEETVASYVAMLRMELDGVQYSKTAARRDLKKKISRTDGAIEFKHQNISAVLESLGRVRIRGYKPARNYQHALLVAVEKAARELPLIP